MSIRSWLYAVARFMGDVNAVKKGPKATGKRVARRLVWKATGRLLGKLFR